MAAAEPQDAAHAARRILVVTVNYRSADLAVRCVRSVAAQRHGPFSLRMALVDNASPDDSMARLNAELATELAEGWLSLTRLDCNGGFGWANNQAILASCAAGWRPTYVWLINPDCEAEPGALTALIEALDAEPGAGAAGSQLLDEQGRACASAFRFPGIRNEFLGRIGLGGLARFVGAPLVHIAPDDPTPPDWVTGASVMLRTDALARSGLFDDGFFLYFEEVELMHRMRRHGWTCLLCAGSRVAHVGGATTGLVDAAPSRPRPAYWFRSRRRYFARTRGPLRAWLASISWQAGSALRPALARLRGRDSTLPFAREERALMRQIGLWPDRHDRESAVASLSDPPGRPPAWQEWDS